MNRTSMTRETEFLGGKEKKCGTGKNILRKQDHDVPKLKILNLQIQEIQ